MGNSEVGHNALGAGREGKEFEVKLREMKPGMLLQEIKDALRMPEGAPPPWLINMQVLICRWIAKLSLGKPKGRKEEVVTREYTINLHKRLHGWRIAGLHQVTSIGSTDITDTWEPLEEGLLPLETTRHVSMITITLSKEEQIHQPQGSNIFIYEIP